MTRCKVCNAWEYASADAEDLEICNDVFGLDLLLDISGDCSLCESGNFPLTVRLVNGLIKNNKATKREQLSKLFNGKKAPGRIKKQIRRLSKYNHKPVIINMRDKTN